MRMEPLTWEGKLQDEAQALQDSEHSLSWLRSVMWCGCMQVGAVVGVCGGADRIFQVLTTLGLIHWQVSICPVAKVSHLGWEAAA